MKYIGNRRRQWASFHRFSPDINSGLEDAVKRVIQAGVDILVFGNNSVYERDIIPQAVSIIRDLIQSGEISENRIDQSYQRIINAKKTFFE